MKAKPRTSTSKKRTTTGRTPHRTARRGAAPRAPDAIAMLKADHAKVDEMFSRYETLRGAERKKKLVAQICDELKIHTRIEEEIFYPTVRAAIGDDALMDEATVEHQSAKELIRQLEGMSVDDDLYDAKVKVLGEYIKHHVKEEHEEMFPKARRSDVDLAELGARMRERKASLGGGIVSKLRRALG
jgi:hemerythrin-like domain-containing protein